MFWELDSGDEKGICLLIYAFLARTKTFSLSCLSFPNWITEITTLSYAQRLASVMDAKPLVRAITCKRSKPVSYS